MSTLVRPSRLALGQSTGNLVIGRLLSSPWGLKNALQDVVGLLVGSKSKKVSMDLPPRPELRGTRDLVVDEGVTQLLDSHVSSLAFLGPAGIGKTAVAQELVHNMRLIERFANQRFWVDCKDCPRWQDIVDAILDVIGVSKLPDETSSNLLAWGPSDSEASISHSSDALTSTLVVLDYFDSVWDQQDQRDSVSRTLPRLWDAYRVRVIITMRADRRPSFVKWSSVIDPLDYESARWLYLSINPTSDERLQEMLQSVYGNPRAIIALAESGRDDGVTPADHLESWQIEETAVRDSIVETPGSAIVPHILSTSDAMKLLAILSILPAKIREAELPELAPHIDDIHSAIEILTQHSVATLHADGYISMMSPMRTYSLQYHRLDSESRQNVYDYYFSRTRRVACRQGDKDYVARVNFFLEQENNIFAVLEDALDHNCPIAVSAAIEHADLLCCTVARPRVARKAVEAAEKCTPPELLCHCLEWQGNVHRAIGELGMAAWAMGQAADRFQAIEDYSSAARCLQARGEINYQCGGKDDGVLTMRNAHRLFARCGDQMGEFRCLLNLAQYMVDQDQENYEEAVKLYEEAHGLLEKLGDDLGEAYHRYYLATVPSKFTGLGPSKRYTALEEALHIFEKHHNYTGVADCLKVLRMYTRDASEECHLLERMLEIYRRLGRQLDAAFAARWLAEVYTGMERYDEALTLYDHAISEFWNYSFIFGGAECEFQKGLVYLQMDRIADALVILQISILHNARNGDKFRAAVSALLVIQCHEQQGNYDLAKGVAETYTEELQWYEDQYGENEGEEGQWGNDDDDEWTTEEG